MATNFIVGCSVVDDKYAYILADTGSSISIIASIASTVIAATPKASTVDGLGNWYVSFDSKITKMNSSGTVNTAWATSGTYTSLANTSIRDLALDNNNNLLYCHPVISNRVIGLISSAGTIVATDSAHFWDYGDRVAFAQDGQIYLGFGDEGSGQPHCLRYTAALVTDVTFASLAGDSGIEFLAIDKEEYIHLWTQDNDFGKGYYGKYSYALLTAAFSVLHQFTTNNGILHSGGNVYLATNSAVIQMNTTTGAVTNTFHTGGVVYDICELANGNIAAVGRTGTNQDGATVNINILDTSLSYLYGSSVITGNLYSVVENYYETLSFSITDKQYSNSLIAVSNEQVWYQSATSTMSEITAARGTISTASPLTIAEGFQKAFIANGSVFKIVDLATIKLSTGELGAGSVSVPAYGAILSGDTSGAGMICDFVTGKTGACKIYGYQIGDTAFSSNDTVKDVGATASVSFSLTTAQTEAPHFYDWTPYANDTTNYGSMPGQSYIVCRYRGRMVLAGHPNYPHQWYMSKMSSPFDWVYGSSDPLTAVAGNNADAAEIGDIVRALVPYGDDFLVFGCAGSIHILNGDPASGGSIDELSNTTGMFSPWSWCKDSKGDLYFFGNDGLYIMAGGRSKPQIISNGALPNLKSDWAVDPSTHRIILLYNPERNAVLLMKTLIADGSNVGYWYQLDTGGFYPCSLPNKCGIYSNLNYNADDPDYRKTLFGCADGYIKTLSDSAKDDDIGASDAAISAFVTFPIEKLIEDEDVNGKVTSLTFVNAGGVVSGDYSDSDGFIYEIHRGDDAEAVLENIRDGATAFITDTVTTTGRQTKKRTKIKCNYLGIKLINDNVGETFAINKIVGSVKPAGKVR